ncbi:hypothetical protein BSKO_01156 [Bryopsis sp. KO-2023]|nr:hypothetical protein BSKO_01156 [Bryopsis sp. KO-2023]
MHGAVRQLSGLQAEVLALYRRAFRVARTKEPQLRSKITEMAKADIAKHKGMSFREIMRIEHLIRKGHKQLDVLSSNAVTDIGGWS